MSEVWRPPTVTRRIGVPDQGDQDVVRITQKPARPAVDGDRHRSPWTTENL